MPRVRGALEQISHWAFDTQTILAATTELTFFQQNVSAGPELTNMKASGFFAAPERMQVKDMRISYSLEEAFNDIQTILVNGYVRMEVGAKTYLDGVPLELFNGGMSQVAIATNVDAAATREYLGSGNPNSVLKFARPIPINQNEAFFVTVRWNPAPGPASNVTMKIKLGGILWRAVQ